MDKNIKPLRIGDLEFGPCTYLCEPPKNPSWEIKMWYPNFYYGKKDQYEYEGNGMYIDPKFRAHRIHESCFKHPESCYTLGSFRYIEKEDFYEFQFCGKRPMDLKPENREPFWELLVYGNYVLNEKIYEDDEEFD